MSENTKFVWYPTQNSSQQGQNLYDVALQLFHTSAMSLLIFSKDSIHYLNKISTVLSGLLQMKAIEIQKRFANENGPIVQLQWFLVDSDDLTDRTAQQQIFWRAGQVICSRN